jgi:alpha-tubulin suppressor-like RCC1 family protein
VCWGDQSRGARNPVQGQYTEVSAGGSHTCGLKTDRTVACWGLPYPNNTRGASRSIPVRIKR